MGDLECLRLDALALRLAPGVSHVGRLEHLYLPRHVIVKLSAGEGQKGSIPAGEPATEVEQEPFRQVLYVHGVLPSRRDCLTTVKSGLSGLVARIYGLTVSGQPVCPTCQVGGQEAAHLPKIRITPRSMWQ